MMAYKTTVRACCALTSGRESFYQQFICGTGQPYWERISRARYLHLRSKADRTNTIAERRGRDSRSVDRELFFEVSPL